jgi:hypothetical protein
MAKFEETPTRLRVELGMPKFNGSVAVFDKSTGMARIEQTNLFFKSRPREFPLAEIAAIRLVKASQAAAYPQIVMRDGKRHSLPSFSIRDAQEAVPRMTAFLGTD